MSNETMSTTTAAAPVLPTVATQEDATPAGMTHVSDIIGEAYKGWKNGRVIFDCGTGRGKNEFKSFWRRNGSPPAWMYSLA